MTGWIVSFGWNWALVPVGVWFLRKLWFATRTPSLKYLQHSMLTQRGVVPIDKVSSRVLYAWNEHRQYPSLYPTQPPLPGDGESRFLLDVLRRGRMFPWGMLKETWLVGETRSVREGDGLTDSRDIHKRLLGVIEVAEARKAELEDLSK